MLTKTLKERGGGGGGGGGRMTGEMRELSNVALTVGIQKKSLAMGIGVIVREAGGSRENSGS